MMDVFRLGVLFSTSGDYAAIGSDCRDGAALAIAELQAEIGRDFAIAPIFGDPAGSGARYIDLARRMVAEDGCRHIIGTVTSQARKDVIPVMEKHDGQLWYVCPYEGFEANGNVIYTGACPNQHLIPLFAHLLPTQGRRVYLAGANYVWGWEMNRLAREIVTEAGGEIVGERCLPIGDTDIGRLVAEVEARRPDFVLSNMLGPSNHAFLRAMRDLGRRDPRFTPERCPVVSCDLTECELPDIGLGVADGQLATAAYFDSLDTPENRALKARVAARFGTERRVSSYFATSYATVRLCVEAAVRCGSDDPAHVRAALTDHTMPSALGPLRIDDATNHTGLPFHLGRIAGDGFEVLRSQPCIAADPYLVARRPLLSSSHALKPQLRIVS
ncbi:transporter substrate-binding protein [Lichenifustis flavocetrariae]|uniref:Transporter substrate-binding protein n=1 Tax=Lichenifustis flavocetrariae TaxID=2949735 RepID=A0AA41Z6F5_9HYPH|nr:transporter substrate-binding protein [Lichenifustis flavocetrariae]MCW6511363.1 transporter substrate-binding protein [Lichenifustis flavocetrariae]